MNSFSHKNLRDLPVEPAHGGSGARQVIFSVEDALSPHLEAFTKGYLQPGAAFDWHDHLVDEFFIVLKGGGRMFVQENGDERVTPYESGDIFYCRAGLLHRIVCEGSESSEYLFVRLDG